MKLVGKSFSWLRILSGDNVFKFCNFLSRLLELFLQLRNLCFDFLPSLDNMIQRFDFLVLD